MDDAPEVICLGETMVLVSPEDGPLATATTASLHVAGAESTVAWYLADLGHRVAWLSRVGADPFGDRILAELADGGVLVEGVTRDPDAPTGVYFKDPTPTGTTVRYYRSGSAASRLSPDDVASAVVAGVRVVHTSGITVALSTGAAAAVETLFARAGEVGAVRSFDVNHRPGLWSAADAAAPLLALARTADLVLVGRDEGERLWGTTSAGEIRALIGDGPDLVVKDEAVGATLFAGDTTTHEAPAPVEVVEPVGAGDAFAAGYLSGLLRGLDPAERLRLGHRLAALSLGSRADHVDARALRAASADARSAP